MVNVREASDGTPIPTVGSGLTGLVASFWSERCAIRARLRALAIAAPALDLRLARTLAWFRERDLAPLGYSGWLAFTRENVDWQESWIRGLVRLVRSGLTEVLQAACEGRVPLSVAVTAPAECRPVDQERWIAAAMAGPLTRPLRAPSGASSTIEPDPVDGLVIWHARQKVRLLEGLPLADREADERMLAWWREGRPAEEIVAAALAPAPRPLAGPGDAALEWGFSDPADLLLGPWRAPSDLAEAMHQLRTVQCARQERALELGRLYDRVVRQGLYKIWGFPTVEAFCQATMGLCARSLQRHRELGRSLRRLPALGAAAAAGMSLSRVQAIARVATADDVERWVAVAGRTPVIELEQATRHVQAGEDPEALLDAYEAVMAATTGTVGLAVVQAPVPPPLTDRVHPDLPAAARWLLAIQLPPQRGFGRVKERDRFVCANPECRRRALRNHAHHVHARKDGGDDALENGICLCVSCHLRLVHTGIAKVERVGVATVWTLPGRTITVV